MQGLSIILLSLALGFINYRIRSLAASMLAHFGANFLAALVITQAVFNLNVTAALFSLPAILGELLLSSAALIILPRSSKSLPDPTQTADVPPSRLQLKASWPVLLAGIIFLVVAAAEFSAARSQPQAAPLALRPVWSAGPQSLRYELTNRIGDHIGEAECQLQDEHLEITCSSQIAAYAVTIDQSTWMSDGGSRVDHARWSSSNGRLISGRTGLDLRQGSFQLEMEWEVLENGLQVSQAGSIEEDGTFIIPYQETPLAGDPNLLLVPDHTWPWQLSGIHFQPGEGGAVVRFNPYTWRESTRDMGPLWEIHLVAVVGLEEVATPAGRFEAWKVDLGGNQSAWYRVDDQAMVMFINGAETWSLN